MGDYLPHTASDIAQMLGFLGLSSLDELFEVVPQALRAMPAPLAPGRSEPDVLKTMRALGASNRAEGLVCFAGAGAYDHEVPPVVSALASRSEFVTAYTPYQPELSQGGLQAIFEFQTMVARLFGLPIANASLYDGASALVEALNLALSVTGRRSALVSAGVHPHWRAVASTFAAGTGNRLVEVPLRRGATDWGSVAEVREVGAVVIAYPNYLGCIEQVEGLRAFCAERGALLVAVCDPVAAAVLQSAGDLGAQVAVGEGQALGMPLSMGGPYLGLFACDAAHVRRLPGRLVGETIDADSKRAYVTTLRTREQDIRREKATSNVCTNQTLMAVTAAIQLAWLGRSGLVEVATRSARGTRYCHDQLCSLEGVAPLTPGLSVLREFALKLPLPAGVALERLAEEGFLGGVALDQLVGDGDGSVERQDASRALLVAVTERRTRDEIDRFCGAFDKAIR
ncbi:MAG: aminomethyl-transferring glycine dehydrogenase subunit GcvPA [Acidimicrobiales bacterium]